MRKIRISLVFTLVVAVSMLCACFPKGYTDKEEKEQLKRAEKIAKEYLDENTSGGRLEHNGLSVVDEQKPGDPALYLTDWVRGIFLDGGEYEMYINTETGEVYTDLEWYKVNTVGSKLAQKLYGLEEDRMRVKVGGHLELPYKADDDSFGDMTISGMIPADVTVDKACVKDILFGGRYEINYIFEINEDVDIDIFRDTDTETLGKDVRIIVSQYPNDVFRQLVMGGGGNKADLYSSKIATYDSDAPDEDEEEPEVSESGEEEEEKEEKEEKSVPGDEAMIEYLEGEWEIMDGPGHIQEPGEERDILHFGNSENHGSSYSKNGEIARFKYELIDKYDTGKPLYDFLILRNRDGEPKFGWDEVRDTQSFQIFLANDYGHDYMMLRECGVERTGFATDGLGYDRGSQGTWFFSRYVPWIVDEDYETNDVMPSTLGKEDELRIKGESFHAIKWTEFGNSCTLQRVEPVPVTIEDYDGKDTDGLCFAMPDDEYAYSTVNYEYKDREKFCHDGYFDPQFVNVTTDKNGQIVEMSVIDYAYDGYWYDTSTEVDLGEAEG